MGFIKDVLFIGFSEKILDQVNFYSSRVNFTFIDRQYEHICFVTQERKLSNFHFIFIAPCQETYIPKEFLFTPCKNNNNLIYLSPDNQIIINDILILKKLGILKLLLDTENMAPRTETILFLPELPKQDNKLIEEIKNLKIELLNSIKNGSTTNIILNNRLQKYLGAKAVFQFLSIFWQNKSKYSHKNKRDKNKIFLKRGSFQFAKEIQFPENEKYCILIEDEAIYKNNKEYKSLISNLNSIQYSQGSMLEREIQSWEQHSINEEIEIKNLNTLDEKKDVINIVFHNLNEVSEHKDLNTKTLIRTNPIHIYPNTKNFFDQIFTIMPKIYPVVDQNSFSESINGKILPKKEYDWPPKTNIFFNKIIKEYNASKPKISFIGNDKNLTYWANKIQISSKDKNGHVLIYGETGSGKELTAEILHFFTFGNDEDMKSVNCATIPQNLADSILFGHKKGAFTGASEDQAGLIFSSREKKIKTRYRTLFLDEINHLPEASLAKLLRFMETGEFSKLGSNDTKFSNIRIVAATNLESFLKNKKLNKIGILNRFRYTIEIPALRHRKEDIPLLIKYHWNLYLEEVFSQSKRNQIYIDKLRLMTAAQVKNFTHQALKSDWKNSNIRGLKSGIREIVNRELAIAECELSPYQNNIKIKSTKMILDDDFIQILLDAKDEKKNGKELHRILFNRTNGGYQNKEAVLQKIFRIKSLKGNFKESGKTFERINKELRSLFKRNGQFADYPKSTIK